MKLYHFSGQWQLPGRQDKLATRVDIPSNPADLCDWLNARDVSPFIKAQMAPQSPVKAPPEPVPTSSGHEVAKRSGDFTTGEIEAFILDVATVAQVGRIFEALGTRFAEAWRTHK